MISSDISSPSLRERVRTIPFLQPGSFTFLMTITPCAARCWPCMPEHCSAFYARTARALGIPDGRTGSVTVIQRFGSGLQLNVHFHTLALDGVVQSDWPRA